MNERESELNVDDSIASPVGGQLETISHAESEAENDESHDANTKRRWALPAAAVTVAGVAAIGAFALLAGNGDAAIVDYDTNLAAIQSHSGRNTNHDDSPFRQTPLEDLDISDGSPLITLDRSEYLQEGWVGEEYFHQENAFPVATGGQFRTACEFSHFAYDDPILNPGDPGAAHLHMFFGNTDINAFSTYETMRETGSSTCNGGELNRTGYWAPAMIDPDPSAPGGAWVRVPERVVVYYKGENIANGSNPDSKTGGSNVYRPEMAMVAPNPGVSSIAAAQGGLGGIGIPEWKCTSNFSPVGIPETTAELPVCEGDQWFEEEGWQWSVLEMNVKFPNCFNTSKEDSDWQAWETVGPNDWFIGNCTGELSGEPNSNYEIFPHLEYFVNYRVEPGEDTGDWFLSSDVDPDAFTLERSSGSSIHGDWWGAWHPEINEEWIDNCVNTGWDLETEALSGCGFGYLSDGGTASDAPLPGRALARRPEWAGDDKIPLETLFGELCEPNDPSHSYSAAESGAYCK